MADDTRAAMQRVYDEVVNGGNHDLIDELFADDFVEHEEFPGLSNDREGVKQFFGMMSAAFDGFRMDVEDLYADGDTAIARLTIRGTHSGEFMGVPASGKEIAVPTVDIVRFAGGKAVEHWGVTDAMAMMQQLGAIPEEAPGG